MLLYSNGENLRSRKEKSAVTLRVALNLVWDLFDLEDGCKEGQEIDPDKGLSTERTRATTPSQIWAPEGASEGGTMKERSPVEKRTVRGMWSLRGL